MTHNQSPGTLALLMLFCVYVCILVRRQKDGHIVEARQESTQRRREGGREGEREI
jgi:hypothetical protein